MRLGGAAAVRLLIRWMFNKRVSFHSFSSSSSPWVSFASTPILGPNLPDIWVPPPPPPPPPHLSHFSSLHSNGLPPVTATIMDGRPIAKHIKSQISAQISEMRASLGKAPGLAVVLVGSRRDSHSFIRIKLKACDDVGIVSWTSHLPQDCSEDDVIGVVSRFNKDPAVHGIIVQLPLPQHLDEENIINFVSPEKDVDGFHPLNIGNLAMRGREPFFIPCASKGCIELLLRHGVEIAGKKAAIIGRSKIVGLPTSLLLQRHHATISTVHAFTENPEQITREADILVSDVGIPDIVRGSWIKPGAIVIDTGTNSVKDLCSQNGFRVTGDVCYEEAIGIASAITPVPGGVGPVTISMLLSNTLDSAKRAFELS